MSVCWNIENNSKQMDSRMSLTLLKKSDPPHDIQLYKILKLYSSAAHSMKALPFFCSELHDESRRRRSTTRRVRRRRR